MTTKKERASRNRDRLSPAEKAEYAAWSKRVDEKWSRLPYGRAVHYEVSLFGSDDE